MPPKLSRSQEPQKSEQPKQFGLDKSLVIDQQLWSDSMSSSSSISSSLSSPESSQNQETLSSDKLSETVQDFLDNFASSQWKTLKTENNENLYLKPSFETNSLTFLLTDLLSCWWCSFDSHQLEILNSVSFNKKNNTSKILKIEIIFFDLVAIESTDGNSCGRTHQITEKEFRKSRNPLFVEKN